MVVLFIPCSDERKKTFIDRETDTDSDGKILRCRSREWQRAIQEEGEREGERERKRDRGSH